MVTNCLIAKTSSCDMLSMKARTVDIVLSVRKLKVSKIVIICTSTQNCVMKSWDVCKVITATFRVISLKEVETSGILLIVTTAKTVSDVSVFVISRTVSLINNIPNKSMKRKFLTLFHI